jgi:threonine dehydrogenase-like Zn-dependent dehydrogenase
VKALVYTRPGVVEVCDVAEPDPADGEVVVHVAAAGICGSELHGISTPGFRTPPLVMGHEFAGTLPTGERVTVNPILSCGACAACAGGSPQICGERRIVGVHRPGGFAERVAVPASAVVRVPDRLDLVAATLVEPLANGVHAWGLAGRPAGARVGILGAGTIGLVCLHIARRGGAGRIAVAEPATDRHELARRYGADEVGPTLDGTFDVVIDAAGVPAARAASVQRLRPGGTAVWVGLMGTGAAFDPLDLIRNEKRVVGSFAYTPEEFAEAVETAADLPPDRLDAWLARSPLRDGARVFTELMNGRTDVVKAVLLP